LNEYLAKSLNIELINIILQAITDFSEPSWTEIKLVYAQQGHADKEDFDTKFLANEGFKIRKLQLSRIQIKDPYKYDESNLETVPTEIADPSRKD
jgi:hypothetical protein